MNSNLDRLDRIQELLESTARLQLTQQQQIEVLSNAAVAFSNTTVQHESRLAEHEVRLASLGAIITRLDAIIERLIYREGRDSDG
jgi:hypothetical protein